MYMKFPQIKPALLHVVIWAALTCCRSDNARLWCLYKSVCFLKTFYKLKTMSCLMYSVALIPGDSPSFSPLCHHGKFELIVCFPSYYIPLFGCLFNKISYEAWFHNLWQVNYNFREKQPTNVSNTAYTCILMYITQTISVVKYPMKTASQLFPKESNSDE